MTRVQQITTALAVAAGGLLGWWLFQRHNASKALPPAKAMKTLPQLPSAQIRRDRCQYGDAWIAVIYRVTGQLAVAADVDAATDYGNLQSFAPVSGGSGRSYENLQALSRRGATFGRYIMLGFDDDSGSTAFSSVKEARDMAMPVYEAERDALSTEDDDTFIAMWAVPVGVTTSGDWKTCQFGSKGIRLLASNKRGRRVS